MKKTIKILFVLFFGMVINSQAQEASKDFFAGKWEITIFGTPQGDAKMVAHLVRKDGKLTGEMTNPIDPAADANPINGIEESADGIELSFSASGYDLVLPLKKKDDDNLEGQLMSMFDVKAKRLKE